MVLQALEGLSDRTPPGPCATGSAGRWPAGWPLTTRASTTRSSPIGAPGCASSERPERIFDAVRAVIDATGVLKGKTRRALDSTLLHDAVATQDTVTQLIAAIRRVRRVVPGALDVPCSPPTTTTAAGKPLIAWDDPVAKAALVDGLVTDALDSLAHSTLPSRSADASLRPRSVGSRRRPRRRTRRATAPGRLPRMWPPIGSSRPSIPRLATCASPALSTETATRPTSPSSPRPGSLPWPSSPRPTSSDGQTALELVADRSPPVSRFWATRPMGPARRGPACGQRGHRQLIKPDAVCGGRSPVASIATISPSITTPAPPPARPGITVPIAPKGNATFGAKCRGCALRERCTTAHGAGTHHPSAMTTSSSRPERQWRARDDSRGLPTMAPDGRALHCVAGGHGQPPGPLPRRREESARLSLR